MVLPKEKGIGPRYMLVYATVEA